MAAPALVADVFWTSADDDPTEFVAEDPLALDYLAQQVGNALLPGFTTRTSRANTYTVVLYGLRAAERCLERHDLPPGERVVEETFERFERIWALAVTHHFGGKPPAGERMRGVRGAEKTYAASNPERLPTDYRLISRQLELGSLGAYLTSCRHHGLVDRDALRLTPVGRELAAALFVEASDTRMHGQYDEFVDVAMEPDRDRIPSKVGKLTLQRIGELSRLGRIRERPDLQERLHQLLFAESPDATTRELASLVPDAAGRGLGNPEQFFPALAAGTLPASPELARLAELAHRFGDAGTALRVAFDDLFARIVGIGWMGRLEDALASWLPGDAFAELQERCRALLAAPSAALFARLQVHGPTFLRTARVAVDADRAGLASALLDLHESVQRERSRGRGWIRRDGGEVAIDVPAYEPATVEAGRWFHDFKLRAVTQLLTDLGRLS